MSDKQIEANRLNGAKGGPKTPEGKDISKMNALRHSLTAQKVLLNSEEAPLFEAMMAGYMDLLKPLGLEEIDLVREIVSGKWRQERWWQIESSLLDLAISDAEPEIAKNFTQLDHNGKVAYALVKQHGHLKALELVSRYEGRMRRLHQNARKDLEKLQSARKAPAPKAPPNPRTNEPKFHPNPPKTDPPKTVIGVYPRPSVAKNLKI